MSTAPPTAATSRCAQPQKAQVREGKRDPGNAGCEPSQACQLRKTLNDESAIEKLLEHGRSHDDRKPEPQRQRLHILHSARARPIAERRQDNQVDECDSHDHHQRSAQYGLPLAAGLCSIAAAVWALLPRLSR